MRSAGLQDGGRVRQGLWSLCARNQLSRGACAGRATGPPSNTRHTRDRLGADSAASSPQPTVREAILSQGIGGPYLVWPACFRGVNKEYERSGNVVPRLILKTQTAKSIFVCAPVLSLSPTASSLARSSWAQPQAQRLHAPHPPATPSPCSDTRCLLACSWRITSCLLTVVCRMGRPFKLYYIFGAPDISWSISGKCVALSRSPASAIALVANLAHGGPDAPAGIMVFMHY